MLTSSNSSSSRSLLLAVVVGGSGGGDAAGCGGGGDVHLYVPVVSRRCQILPGTYLVPGKTFLR